MNGDHVPIEDQLTAALDEIRILRLLNEKQADEIARLKTEKRDMALPVSHTYGRSKLFKTEDKR